MSMGLDNTLEVVENHIHLFLYNYTTSHTDGQVLFTGLGVSNSLESKVRVEDSLVTFTCGDNSFTIQGDDKDSLDIEFILHKTHILSKIFLVQPGKKFSDLPKTDDEDEDIGNKKSKSLSSKRLSSLKSMEISPIDEMANKETQGIKSQTRSEKSETKPLGAKSDERIRSEDKMKPEEKKSMDLETFKALHQGNKSGKKSLTPEDIDTFIDEIVKEEPNLPYLPKSVYTLLLRVRHVYNKNLYSPEEWLVYRETIKNNILNSYKKGRR